MHNLHHNSTKVNFNSSNGSSTNKSMSLSHPSLAQPTPRSLRQLTTISCDRSPLWTALTTAQVITVDVEVDYVDDDSWHNDFDYNDNEKGKMMSQQQNDIEFDVISWLFLTENFFVTLSKFMILWPLKIMWRIREEIFFVILWIQQDINSSTKVC